VRDRRAAIQPDAGVTDRRRQKARGRRRPWLGLPLLLATACVEPGAAEVEHYGVGSGGMRAFETPAPIPALPEDRTALRWLASDSESGGVIGGGATGSAPGATVVWRFGPAAGQVVEIALPRESGLLVTAAADTGRGVVLGTSNGLLRVTGDAAEWWDMFPGAKCTTTLTVEPSRVREYVAALAVDVEANLWAAGSRRRSIGYDGFSGFTVLPTDPARWITELLSKRFDRPYPRLLRWRAPFRAMAGDAAGPGVWVYGVRGDGRPDLMHVDPAMATVIPKADPDSSVPAGTAVPSLADPSITADRQGRVWLAGDGFQGARLYRFEGGAFDDVTPPAALLEGRRFSQLVVGPGGELYAATDGVGVLLLTDGTWAPHPIKESLPTVEGTELKPVSCMAIDRNSGYLWVGTDNNVLCWTPD